MTKGNVIVWLKRRLDQIAPLLLHDRALGTVDCRRCLAIPTRRRLTGCLDAVEWELPSRRKIVEPSQTALQKPGDLNWGVSRGVPGTPLQPYPSDTVMLVPTKNEASAPVNVDFDIEALILHLMSRSGPALCSWKEMPLAWRYFVSALESRSGTCARI